MDVITIVNNETNTSFIAGIAVPVILALPSIAFIIAIKAAYRKFRSWINQ